MTVVNRVNSFTAQNAVEWFEFALVNHGRQVVVNVANAIKVLGNILDALTYNRGALIFANIIHNFIP